MLKYNIKKTKNQVLLPMIEKHITPKGVNRIGTCSNYMEFIADEKIEKRRKIGGISCKNRFCPVCSWNRAKKDALILITQLNYIRTDHKKDFILLCFTTPNVHGDDLKAEIAKMNLAFKNLLKRKEIKKINGGCVRKLEITYNSKRDDYHPHFHVIMAVNKSYFKSRDYVKQSTWLDLWRDVMGDWSITQVDVKKMYDKIKNGVVVLDSGVNEVAKYTAKDSDYLYSQEVFDVFYNALSGAQVMTYNGLFKDAMKLYKDKKLDSYKPVDPTEYVWLFGTTWTSYARKIDENGEIFELHEYVDDDKRRLTVEEQVKYNFKSVGEAEDFTDD